MVSKRKLLRFNLFRSVSAPFMQRARQSRMRAFSKIMQLTDETTILDIGGQPAIWDSVPNALDITIVNLPGIAKNDHKSHHRICYVTGDGCDLSEFATASFDIVFCNSVIEHVGDKLRRRALAFEVQRLGKSYWVQTPSKTFPIEAHCGMPFWWLYPTRIRKFFLDRWRKELPDWTHMVETTTIVTKKEMQQLFPKAEFYKERLLLLSKSHSAYLS